MFEVVICARNLTHPFQAHDWTSPLAFAAVRYREANRGSFPFAQRAIARMDLFLQRANAGGWSISLISLLCLAIWRWPRSIPQIVPQRDMQADASPMSEQHAEIIAAPEMIGCRS
jgi:hypothetical protein